MAQQLSVDNASDGQQGYIRNLLSERDPEVLRSILDLVCSKLGRLTQSRVIWSEVPLAQLSQQVNNFQLNPIGIVNKHQPQQPVLVQQQPVIVKNQPIPIPVYSGSQNNNNNQIIQPNRSWVEMADEDPQPIPSKKIRVVIPVEEQENKFKPELEFNNNIIENPLPQKSAGIHPGPDAFKIESSTIINSDDYYLVANPPYLGKNKPEEPVFQESDGLGLFYNAVGDCLQTNRSGRILVFRTRKGEYRFATWPKPKAKIETEVSNQIEYLKSQLREWDRKNGWITIRNPAYKSGVSGQPALMTVNKDKKPITREDQPEYFKLLDEMRRLTQSGRRPKVNGPIKEHINEVAKQDSDNKDNKEK